MPEGYERAAEPARADVQSLLERIQQRIGAGDTAGAAALIEASLWQALSQPELRPLLSNWLAALPPEQIAARPRLSLAQVWLRLHRPAEAQRWLEQAQRALGLPPWRGDRAAAAEAAALGAQIAAAQGDDQRVAEDARLALEVLPTGHPLLTGAVLALGRSCLHQGQTERAAAVFAHASEQSFAAGSPASGAAAAAQQAALLRLHGGLGQARAACTAALMQAHAQDGHTTPEAGLLLVLLADLYRERNDLDAAQTYAANGLALARGPEGLLPWLGLLVQTRIALARGDFGLAQTLLERLRQQPTPSGTFAAVMEGCAAQLALATADLDSAAEIAAALPGSPENLLREAEPIGQIYADEHILIPPLQMLITLGDATGEHAPLHHALTHLAPLLLREDLAARRWLQIKLRVLWALAQEGLGAHDQALMAISEALEQAVGEGYARVLLDEGVLALRLLRRFRDQGSPRAASVGAEAEAYLRSYAQHLADA